MNDYDEGKTIKMAVPDRDTVLQHGTFYAADVRLLHKTVRRKKEGARVSIDFRFRLHDPIYRAMVPPVVGPEGGFRPVDEHRVPATEGDEGIKHQRAVGRAFLLQRHVVPGMGDPGRREVIPRRRHELLQDAADGRFAQVGALAAPGGDQGPEQPPR